MNGRRVVGAVCLAVGLVGCGVTVHADRSRVGGGPAQATAQAQAQVRATAVAAATAQPVSSGQSCDCESSGR